VPLAHWLSCVQNAPVGARQLPPVHAVFIGQSVLDEHVAQTPPGHACVMHPAGVQASEPAGTQKWPNVHWPPAQSESTAQGAPPGRAQTPASHASVAQSDPLAHAVHTLALHRFDPHATSSAHGSPPASLQKPPWQIPL